MPRLFNYFRFLSIFIIGLFGFLAAATAWLSTEQLDRLKTNTNQRAQRDLDAIADLSLEALIKSDYVTARTFVERWADEHPEYPSIVLVSANGFVLAEKSHPAPDPGQTFTLAKKVQIGETLLATARLTGSYQEAESLNTHLQGRLLLGAALISAMLGAALWFVMHKLALEPLELMVKERTRDLAEANDSLTQEIEERRTLQAALQQREEWIALLLGSVAVGIYGVDLEGRCTFCNPAALKLLGYDRQEDLIGKPIHSIIHHTLPSGESYPPEECKVYRCLVATDGCGRHVEDEVFWRADGTSFSVDYWAQPIVQHGANVGVVVAFADISHRKQSEEALRQAAREWQETFDAVNEAIWILDENQRVLRSNAAAAEIFHVSPEELIGKHCWKVVHNTEEPIPECPTLRVKHSCRRESMELQVENRWFEITVAPIIGDDGQCHRYVHAVCDITQRRMLEEQLRQGQKMEALGTLAGGIAHDFNNILNVIIGYTDLAKIDYNDPEKVRQDLDEISQGAERARKLVRQILSFSRKKTTQERQPIQVSVIVKEVLKMLRASLPSTIEIKQQIGAEGMVEGDPTQIHQVIMNLCTNAFHSMGAAGGTLTVALEEILVGADEARAMALTEGQYIKLTVSDTGAGIPPEVIGKIFEPYFTTKGYGEGTGLGLAVVHGIVSAYRGHVAVTSQPDQGTTFHVYLPTTSASSVAPSITEAPAATIPGHGERILFVDDEEQLCGVVRTFFTRAGYEMATFTDPLLAWQEFEKGPDRFDLVITDMTMPHITGAELTHRILALRNDVPVIICTGYSSLIDREKAALAGISAYLAKPISPQRLLDEAQKILANKNQPS